MQMDYFRRPQLAGLTLQRLSFGTVRGNLRRLDPDGISAVPYFAGVVTGDTLNLVIDGTPFNVPLTGGTPTYQSILSDINSAIAGAGSARDSDGSIEIQTTTAGGSIEVVGGSAALAIGFDVSRSVFYSSGGDIPSSPEGRDGTPFGTAFPGRRENLATETVTRSLGRLASNIDVLYADHARRDARFAKVDGGSTTVSSPAAGTSIITLPAGTEVFTGLGVLSSSPTPEDLAPFVQLIDPVTKLPPATCRVVGIVRGAVSGSPPYAAASSFTSAGSVVNVDLVKTSTTIEAIVDGRVIRAPSGTDYTTNGTRVGDWAKISGATNAVPWSNGGYRWVVEAIIDARHLALRPMSQSEFAQANPSVTVTDAQPLVELNGQISGIESYGSLEVRTGTFVSGARLVVQPEIPAGATYDVWVSQPKSLRSSNSGTGAEFPSFSSNISQRDALSNDLVSGFRLSGSTSSQTLSEGFVRMHGRLLRIPAATYTPGGLGADGTYFVYFDESDARVKVTTTPPASLVAKDQTGVSANPVIHFLAKLVVVSGAFSSQQTLARYSTLALERVTVGLGADFATIDDAAAYVSALSASTYAEAGSLVAYPHFEVVLLHSMAAAGALIFDCPSISIRGVNPLVTLTLAGTPNSLSLLDCYFFKMEDLIIAGPLTPLVTVGTQSVSNVGVEVYLRRVRRASGSASSFVVKGAGQLKKLVMDDCFLPVGSGITAIDSPISTTAKQEIFVTRSHIPTVSVTTSPTMFASQAGDWRGASLSLRDVVLDGWAPATGGALSLMVKTSTADGSSIFLEEVTMNPGAYASGSDVLLIDAEASTRVCICGLYINGEMPRVVSATHPDSLVERVVSQVRPEGFAAVAVSAPTVRFCRITGNAPVVGQGTLVLAAKIAVGNTITGTAAYGLHAPNPNSELSLNNVSTTCSSGSNSAAIFVPAGSTGTAIVANICALTVTTSGFSSGALTVLADQTVVEGCAATGVGAFAFYNGLGVSQVLSDCRFANNTDSQATGRAVATLFSSVRVSNCRFESSSGLAGVGLVSSSGVLEGYFSNCFATNELFESPLPADNVYLSHAVSASLGTGARKFSGICSFGRFTGNVSLERGATLTETKVGGNLSLDYSQAAVRFVLDTITVAGNLTKAAGASSDLFIRDCTISGSATFGGAQVFSQRNRYLGSTVTTVAGTKVYLESDGVIGHGIAITATVSLRVTQMECSGSLTVTAGDSVPLYLEDISAFGGFTVGACSRLYARDLEAPGSGASVFSFSTPSSRAVFEGCSFSSSVSMGSVGIAGATIQLSDCTANSLIIVCARLFSKGNVLGFVQATVTSIASEGDAAFALTLQGTTSSASALISDLSAGTDVTITGAFLSLHANNVTVDGSLSVELGRLTVFANTRVGGNLVATSFNGTTTGAGDTLKLTTCRVVGNLTVGDSVLTGPTRHTYFDAVSVRVDGNVQIIAVAAVTLASMTVLGSYDQTGAISTDLSDSVFWSSFSLSEGSETDRFPQEGGVTPGGHAYTSLCLRISGVSVWGDFYSSDVPTTITGLRVAGQMVVDAISNRSVQMSEVEVGGIAALSGNPLSISQSRFISNLSVTGTSLIPVAMSHVRVAGALSTSGSLCFNNCQFLAGPRFFGSPTPLNTISGTSDDNLTMDFTDCVFADLAQVLISGSARSRRFSFKGGRLSGTNGVSSGDTVSYALRLNGNWQDVAFDGVSVVVDNTVQSSINPGGGILVDGTVNFIRLNSVTIDQLSLALGDPATGSPRTVLVWGFAWHGGGSGTITGCTFRRPRFQTSGGVAIQFEHFKAISPSAAIGIGLIISGCMIYSVHQFAGNPDYSPLFDDDYRYDATHTGTNGIARGGTDILFFGAQSPRLDG